MRNTTLKYTAIAACLSFALPGATLGQGAYASKPIRFIVGGEVLGGTPARFAELLKSEQVKWAKVVRDSGAKVD